ncbi:MAG: diguanylate cyclase domain-containing protein [Rhodoferax sp.]
MNDANGPDSQLLNDLLLRYAEDLRQLMEQKGVLESRAKDLDRLANYDALTSLPNRRLFLDRLAPMVSQSRRPEDSFTLIFIDLDGFKQINDTLGHEIGDRVLQTVATRLVSSVRDTDTAARLGGDEFVIIARTLVGDENIAGFCAKAIRILTQPIESDGHQLSIGCSFGCAEYPRHGENEITLLVHADAAMYLAKAAGGNTYRIYGRDP